MALPITIQVDDPAALLESDAYGTGALVRLERATSQAGSYAEITGGTETIVATTTFHRIWDASGTTSHWYRSRYTNLAGTISSEYSDPFQATSLEAYATLDDLREVMSLGDNTSKYNALADMLVDASAEIDESCGRRFYRDPQVSGTSTWTFDVIRSGQRRLSEALGFGLDIVSVTTLEVAQYSGGTYETIVSGSTGYYLDRPPALATTWPYEDIILSDQASTHVRFYVGRQTVRITGVRGFSAVPPLVKRACIALAQERWRQGPQGGVVAGTSAFGAPVFNIGDPAAYRKLTAPGSGYVKNSYASLTWH